MMPRRAARAIDALRRGWAVTVMGETAAITVRPVETAPLDALLGDGGDVDLLIAPSRAATLKIINQRAAADPGVAVRLRLPGPARAGELIAIADPALDLAHPMKGPFDARPVTDPRAAGAALDLARHAGLLPAFLLSDEPAEDRVAPDDVDAFADPGALRVAARARLPVAEAEDARITAFRSDADAADHVALVVGARDDSVPVVRLHSECLTGDALGSLKCDCGPQLHASIAAMRDARWGVLLYLRQEGRGIGLVNKLRAYALQDQGFDTVDANRRLGFATDARDFGLAARMLELLGVGKVRLLTNNPEKVAGLEARGVEVVERLPVQIAANPHNEAYLATKRDRTGHQL